MSAARVRSAPALPVDVLLVLGVAFLLVAGSLLVASATRRYDDGGAVLTRHLISIGIGTVLAIGVALVPRRLLLALAPVGYLLAVAALVALVPFGTTVAGSRSWIRLPTGYSLQPSEFAKVAMVAALAGWFGLRRHRDRQRGTRPWVEVTGAILIAAVPLALVALQPDVGTLLVMAVTVFGVLLLAGVRWRALVGLVLAGASVLAVAVRAGMLADYQVARFTAFLRPEADTLGVGYNTAQAIGAIGSGGLTGTGLFSGPATQGGFVPEQQADFVLSVAGEELGFVGTGLIVVVFALVVWRIFAAAPADDTVGRSLADGVGCWFAVQGFENIGIACASSPSPGFRCRSSPTVGRR